jgi:hypothetical protein
LLNKFYEGSAINLTYKYSFTLRVGMARGYSVTGGVQKRAKLCPFGIAEAHDPQNKQGVAGMIRKLEKGRDIN